MNLLVPTYMTLPGDLPMGKLIRQADFEVYLQAQDVLTDVQREAHQIKQEAEMIIATAMNEAENIFQRAQQQGEQAAQETIAKITDKSCQEAISKAVHWLMDMQDIERTVIKRLEKDIRAYLSHALMTFFSERDLVELTVQRITHSLADMVVQDKLILRVHRDAKEKVMVQFANDARIRVVDDAACQPGQAIIESPFVQIDIDIKKHIQMLQQLFSEQCVYG